MNRRLALSALALVVIGIVWLSRRGERSPSPPASAPEPAAVASGASEGLLVPTEPTTAETAVPTGETREHRAPVEAPAAPERDPKMCEIRGRFVFASGEPAEGVEVRYDWDTYESAADGTFSILFQDDDNPNVWVELDGYVGFQWEWFGPKHGQVIDVGEVVVERGGTLRVSIVDRDGRTLTDGWTVEAKPEERFYLDGRDDDLRVVAESTGEDGTFVLEHVRTGRVRLQADSSVAGSIDGPAVLVRDGEEAEVEIRYGGPDNAKRILVRLDLERFWWLDFTPEVRLSAPGMEPRLAQPTKHGGQTFSFDDLPGGAYVVEIDDPRLMPWRADGVSPGTALTAEVKGSASLELRVFDAGTGAELEDHGAVLRFRDPYSSPADFDLFKDGGPFAGGVIDGILPGDSTLIVSARGLAPAEIEIEDLAPRERRQIVARLGRGGEIAGTLVRADGSPVPRTEVTLLDADVASLGYGYEEDPARAETDVQGRFAFRNIAPGAYELRAATSTLLEVAKAVEILGEKAVEIRLTLPAESFVSGRVLGPSGASFEGMSIVLEAGAEKESSGIEPDSDLPAYDVIDTPMEGLDEALQGELAAALDPDGAFRIGPVPPGSYTVLLQLPDEVPLGSTTMFLQEARQEIGWVTLKAGENPDRVLDGKPVWPGTLVVRARGDASFLSGARLGFQGRGGGSDCTGVAGLASDVEIRLSPVFPGRYGIVVVGADASWVVAAPELCSLAAGGTARCELDVVLVPGELRITERDSGKPVADRSILLAPQDPISEAFGFALPFYTDEEGMLRATLAPGTYTLIGGEGWSFGRPGAEDLPTIHWTLAGPDPTQVSIPQLDTGDADSEDR